MPNARHYKSHLLFKLSSLSLALGLTVSPAFSQQQERGNARNAGSSRNTAAPNRGGSAAPGRERATRPSPAPGARPTPPSRGGQTTRPTPPSRGGQTTRPTPPSRGGTRPTPPSRGGETTRPTPPSRGGETTRPTPPSRAGETTRPTPPSRGGETTRPTPPSRGGTRPTPPSRGGETTRPTPPSRSGTRPTPPSRGGETTRPTPPSRGGTRPTPPSRGGGTRPTPPSRGGTRPTPPRTDYRRDGTRERVVRGGRSTYYDRDGRTPTRSQHGRVRIDYGRDGSRTHYRGGSLHYRQSYANHNGHRVIQRSYRRHGRELNRYYYPRQRGSSVYYVYRPIVNRPVTYYHYYRSPWVHHVVYPWAWYRDPWYSHYGYYYRPYRYCRGPSWWLTDYYFSHVLSSYYYDYVAQRSYQAALDRAAAQRDRAAAEAALAEAERERAEIDEYIKEQVRQQVEDALADLEQNRDRDVGNIIQDPDHIFTISEDVDVMDLATNQECSLSAGDLIRVRRSESGHAMLPGPNDAFAQMQVITSKEGSCEVGSLIAIAMSDLQNMENDFTETVEDGFEKMQAQRSAGNPLLP